MALISPLLLELNSRYEKGIIRDEHLQAFLERPDAVLTESEEGIESKLIGLIPSGLQAVDLCLADDKPCYIATSDRAKDCVIWGAKKFKSYEEIFDLEWVGGELFYRAVSEGKYLSVVGEEEFGTDRDKAVECFAVAEGKPLCIIESDKGEFIAWGQKKFKLYEMLTSPDFVEGKPLYGAYNGKDFFIVWGEEEFEAFGFANGLSRIEGKFLYWTHDDVGGHGEYVVWGTERFKRYDNIRESPTIAQGKPLYAAYGDAGEVVVWGEEEFVGQDMVCELIFAEGKPLYVARRDDSHFVMWGREIFARHDGSVTNLSFAHGKPLYVMVSGKGRFVVWGQRQFKVYDDIFSVIVTEKGIVYGARKGRRIFRVAVPRNV